MHVGSVLNQSTVGAGVLFTASALRALEDGGGHVARPVANDRMPMHTTPTNPSNDLSTALSLPHQLIP